MGTFGIAYYGGDIVTNSSEINIILIIIFVTFTAIFFITSTKNL